MGRGDKILLAGLYRLVFGGGSLFNGESDMNRSDILSAADQCVTVDRDATHGKAEINFGRIAAYWSAHLDTPISAVDVAVMMNLLKCARIKSNAVNDDNWIDGAGYMAIGGELAEVKP